MCTVDIDDTVFATFGPRQLIVSTRSIKELTIPSSRSFQGLNAAAVVKFFVVLLGTSLGLLLLIVPQLDYLSGAKDALCEGNRGFVVGVKQSGEPMWTKTEGRSEAATGSFSALLLDELRKGLVTREDCASFISGACDGPPNLDAPNWGYETCCWTGVAHVKNPSALHINLASSMAEISNKYQEGYCKDLLDCETMQVLGMSYANSFFTAAADSLPQNKSCPGGCPDRFRPVCKDGRCQALSCADMQPYCHEPYIQAGVNARLFCPQTCGCADAFSPLLWVGPAWGCAKSCSAKVELQIAARPCTDMPFDSPELRAFARELMETGQERGFKLWIKLGESFLKVGCNSSLLQTEAGEGFCHPTDELDTKGARAFCPVSCGCKAGKDFRSCPSACLAAT